MSFQDKAKSVAIDGAVAGAGFGVYDMFLGNMLKTYLGGLLGKYAGIGASYAVAIGYRYLGEKAGYDEYGRIAAASTFGVNAYKALFGIRDAPTDATIFGGGMAAPGVSKPSGGFQSLTPVALSHQVI